MKLERSVLRNKEESDFGGGGAALPTASCPEPAVLSIWILNDFVMKAFTIAGVIQ